MQNPAAPWSVRVQAAGMVADRAYGRALTSVSFEVTKRLNDLTIEELRQLEGDRFLISRQRNPCPPATQQHQRPSSATVQPHRTHAGPIGRPSGRCRWRGRGALFLAGASAGRVRPLPLCGEHDSSRMPRRSARARQQTALSARSRPARRLPSRISPEHEIRAPLSRGRWKQGALDAPRRGDPDGGRSQRLHRPAAGQSGRGRSAGAVSPSAGC
jgi:hypothetical protein